MPRWLRDYPLEMLRKAGENTAMETLGIEIDEVNDEGIWGSMPVDHRHVQPARLLHGGVTCVLVETLGSYGSWLLVDDTRYTVVGQHISCSHLRPVTSGRVRAFAKPVHIGRRSHVWDISVYDSREKLSATGRLTVAVVDRIPRPDTREKNTQDGE